MPGITKKFASSVSWSGTAQTLNGTIGILTFILLARFLSPADFGLVAMVLVFIGFGNLIGELGLSAAIIQNSEINRKKLSSIFWIALSFGFLLSNITMFFSIYLSTFYDQPQVRLIALALSLCLIVNPIILVHKSLLIKQLNFRFLSIANILAKISSSACAISLAYLDFGYWSLVFQQISQIVVLSAILWTKSAWLPLLYLNIKEIMPMLKFGVTSLANTLLDYSTRNIDNVLIGKFFGSDSLGIYAKSYMLLVSNVLSLVKAISNVFYPTIAHFKSDTKRVKIAYLRTLNLISVVIFPIIGMVFAISGEIIPILLGPNWVDMIVFLKIFCLLSGAICIGCLNGAIFLSQGAVRLQLKIGIILKLFVILSMAVGLYWGPKGVAAASGIAALLVNYPFVKYTGSLIGMRYREYLSAFFSPLLISILMVLIMLWIASSSAGLNLMFPSFIVQIVVGMVFYVLTSLAFKVEGAVFIFDYSLHFLRMRVRFAS